MMNDDDKLKTVGIGIAILAIGWGILLIWLLIQVLDTLKGAFE